MVSRRNVNKLVVASTLLAHPLSQLASATREETLQTVKPVHLVYESRAHEYGWRADIEAEAFDVIHYITGDVTKTWYEKLHPLWAEQAIVTAGLTRQSEFFVMKTLARDYGYKVMQQHTVNYPHLVSWVLAPV